MAENVRFKPLHTTCGFYFGAVGSSLLQDAPGPAASPPGQAAARATARRRHESTLLVEMDAAMGRRAEVVCHILGRDPRHPWTHDEIDCFRSSGIEPSSDEQFAEEAELVGKFYDRFKRGWVKVDGARVDYRRRSLKAFLQNWGDEVMKARRAHDEAERAERDPYCTSEPVML